MHIKSILAASVAAVALTGSAVAADLPSRAAPVIVAPAPILTWTGFYAGLNAGYTWNDVRTTSSGFGFFPFAPLGNVVPYTNASAALANTSLSHKNDGFMIGGQLGFNLQVSPMFLLGLETDLQGVIGKSSGGASFGALAPIAGEAIVSTAIARSRLDYFGTLRARVGVVASPAFLVYATGGLAYAGVRSSVLFQQQILGAPAVVNPWFANTSYNGMRAGWTVGGGVEYKFSPRWSAKVEYLYYDLGRVSSTGLLTSANNAGAPFTAALVNTSTRVNGHIVRAGLNYHFGGGISPVVAKY